MEGLTQDCLNAIEGRLIQGHISSPFQGVSINSRTVSKGDLFVCIKGDRFDGHDFLADVIDKKVGGVILSNPKKLPNVPVQDQAQPFLIHVSDTLKALQDLACFQRNRFHTNFSKFYLNFFPNTCLFYLSHRIFLLFHPKLFGCHL